MKKLHSGSCRMQQHGFSMVELVVTMLVVAMLAAIAIPSYSSYTLKSHRTEAKTALLDIASLEERYFTANNAYTSTPSDLGYSGSTAGASFSVGSYYNVAVTTVAATAPSAGSPAGTPATYQIVATPYGNQATKDTSCTSFTLTSGGVQTATGTGSATCWQ